jgi:hypothetical protein
MGGIRRDQWDSYVDEIYRVLKPGQGWAQAGELTGVPMCTDGSVPEGAPMWEVLSLSDLS